jgi:hypothetical protein
MLKELFTELVLNMKNRISDQQWSINDMGMTFGLGLPITGTFRM